MKKLLFFFALCAFLLCGCSESSTNFSSGLQKSNFFAMDTSIEFNIYGDASLLKEAQNVLTDLESEVSVTDPDSEIYKINQDGTGTLTGNAGNLMQEALEMCRRTDGALDISVYPIVRAWGFTTEEYQVPEETEIESLLPLVDYTKIQYDTATGNVSIPKGMTIDLGSIAKGYGGQLAAQLLREKGVTSALLNLGGNVQTIGSKPDGSPWQVGIQDPVTNATLNRTERLTGTLWIRPPATRQTAGFVRSRWLEKTVESAMLFLLLFLLWDLRKPQHSGSKAMTLKLFL